jgi:hypothetical protein
LADEINIDAGAAVSFIAEGSSARHRMKALLAGKSLVTTATAEGEFQQIVTAFAGPLEQARALRFLGRVRLVPDGPSGRALALTPTKNLEWNDIVILGTADALGLPTMTTDRRAVSAARSQGVNFHVSFCPSIRLTGV